MKNKTLAILTSMCVLAAFAPKAEAHDRDHHRGNDGLHLAAGIVNLVSDVLNPRPVVVVQPAPVVIAPPRPVIVRPVQPAYYVAPRPVIVHPPVVVEHPVIVVPPSRRMMPPPPRRVERRAPPPQYRDRGRGR